MLGFVYPSSFVFYKTNDGLFWVTAPSILSGGCVKGRGGGCHGGCLILELRDESVENGRADFANEACKHLELPGLFCKRSLQTKGSFRRNKIF